MTYLVTCQTLFDISATGVRGHYNAGRIPFKDDTGCSIQTQADWEKSRNRQRNWETFNQIISLRILPESITIPAIVKQKPTTWQFEFFIDNLASIQIQNDPVGILVADADNVPMITNLSEDTGMKAWIIPSGQHANTWFQVKKT